MTAPADPTANKGVLIRTPTSATYTSSLSALGFTTSPNTRFTTSDPTAVRSIVSAGLGISLINDLQAGTEKNGIRILPTDPEELVSICLVTPLTPSPAARRFLDFAQAHLSELT